MSQRCETPVGSRSASVLVVWAALALSACGGGGDGGEGSSSADLAPTAQSQQAGVVVAEEVPSVESTVTADLPSDLALQQVQSPPAAPSI